MAKQQTKKYTSSGARRKRKNRTPDTGSGMITRLLILVCVVLVISEGRMVSTLLTHKTGKTYQVTGSSASDNGTADNTAVSSQDTSANTTGAVTQTSDAGSSSPDAGLAGLAGISSSGSSSSSVSEGTDTASLAEATVSEEINSPAVVSEQSESVDDSYFSDAVFIGDSRMEGFRNSSGITQGTFLTSVGLSTSDMSSQQISTSDGLISVYQGLSGIQYGKIYLMLGTNDLGYSSWDEFSSNFEAILKQFHQLQPEAIIYVCSVIYVDESKIEAGFEYDNNENVIRVNGYILDVCEDLWYAYYLNLNEIFSNGHQSLISEASPDGIHLYADYLAQMLDYLKSHYISDDEWQAQLASHEDDTSSDDEDDKSSASGGGDDDDGDEDASDDDAEATAAAATAN